MLLECEIRTPELVKEMDNYGFYVVYEQISVCKCRVLHVPQVRETISSILSV
jgi:hypothetical protein